MHHITQFPQKNLNFTFISFDLIEKIGLGYLSSILKKAGHRVNHIYFGEFEVKVPEASNAEQDLVIDLIKTLKPDVVGFNVFSIFFDLACKLTLRIKKEVSIPIIWGGPHPTLFPEMCIKYADIVCIGEGEKAVAELANKMSLGKSVENIKNLWVKSEAKIVKNQLELLQNLDSIPFPDYGYQNKWLIKNGKVYSLTKEQEEKREYNISTSRGCPYMCTYCSNNVFHKIFSGKGEFVRRRSVKNVIEELKEAKRKFPSLKEIKFFDETFTLDKEWLREFCREYKIHVGMPFIIATHPNNITREMVASLRVAGCHQINVGIQSGSERIRTQIYKRYTSNETLLNMAKIFREFGIAECYDFIMDNPFETEDDYRQTLELLLKIRPFKLHLYSLAFFPKTEITEMALTQGLISKDRVEGANPQIHKFYQWGGDIRLFKEAETARTKENIFWSNLFILARYTFIPGKILWILSKSKFFKKYPHLFSLAASLIDKLINKVNPYKNYFRVSLRYLLQGQVSKLVFKISNRVRAKPKIRDANLASK